MDLTLNKGCYRLELVEFKPYLRFDRQEVVIFLKPCSLCTSCPIAFCNKRRTLAVSKSVNVPLTDQSNIPLSPNYPKSSPAQNLPKRSRSETVVKADKQ